MNVGSIMHVSDCLKTSLWYCGDSILWHMFMRNGLLVSSLKWILEYISPGYSK